MKSSQSEKILHLAQTQKEDFTDGEVPDKVKDLTEPYCDRLDLDPDANYSWL
jgi:hypothetical protein